MQKHLLYINLFAITSALALSACADEVENAVTPDMPEVGEKTPIELSVGGVEMPSAETRAAVITTDPYNPLSYFDQQKATKVFMIMKSVYGTADFGGSQDDKYTVSRGDVEANSNKIVFDDKNIKYWDDAHARSSKLSIWAYAQVGQPTWNSCTFEKDKSGGGYEDDPFDTTGHYDWRTAPIYPFIKNWKASHNTNDSQDATSVMCQDLYFSNNLVDNSATGTNLSGADGSLKFNTGTRKFPQEGEAQMKFYHAMSKITIKIVEGEGFDKTATTDFQFKSGTNVKLNGFNTKGLFSIQQGIFQEISERNPIPSIWLSSTTPTGSVYYTLQALAIPNVHDFLSEHGGSDEGSRFVENAKSLATDVMMEFTIDGNTYKVTSGMLFDALNIETNKTGENPKVTVKTYNEKNYIPLEAGKNYVFTFKISKVLIKSISATIADWIPVEAEEKTPSNAYVSVSVKTNEGTLTPSLITGSTPGFSLYRAPGVTYTGETTAEGYNNYADYTWEKGYETTPATLTESSTAGIYGTSWYWPNNNTFYHFRTLTPTGQILKGNDAVTYVEIAGGKIKSDEVTAVDYLWGAPFKTTSPNPDGYSFTSGFCNSETKADGQLYKAIGATADNITLIQHHMTSQIFVDLYSTSGEDKVDLTDATVTITKAATSANLYLGNGLISGYSNYGSIEMTADAHSAVAGPPIVPAYDYSYCVLPQPLSYGSTPETIGMTITTSDGNTYIINELRTVKANGTSITEWLPGKKYYYKFLLKKTGIDKLTATIVDWEDVEADPETVVIQ